VVIPARDAAETLPAALAGLEQQRADWPFEVIVVDDGSRDQTAELARRSPIVDRVLAGAVAGPARARNAGAAAAAADRLAFLDADCRPSPGWLAAGDAALDAADLVVGHTRPSPDDPLGPFDRTIWVTRASPLFESANMFVRRELFERLGGFENWLGPRNGKELGEDVWLGWSAVRAGARTAFSEEALVYHAVFPRGPMGFAAERWRLRFFPAMAQRMPELRDSMFHHHYFLTERQARFDFAVAGVGLAGLTRQPLLALLALPYLRVIYLDLREPQGPLKVLGRASADAVGLAGLIVGSMRSRTLVL
jgi:glycosyltransferase involved in cell wall biosynthesis